MEKQVARWLMSFWQRESSWVRMFLLVFHFSKKKDCILCLKFKNLNIHLLMQLCKQADRKRCDWMVVECLQRVMVVGLNVSPIIFTQKKFLKFLCPNSSNFSTIISQLCPNFHRGKNIPDVPTLHSSAHTGTPTL